jgi:RimJ/RimL family protein N-acetyltransferase
VNTRTFTNLDTPRLILRRFRDTDLASFMAYRNDREVARYQSWESISRAEAVRFIAQQSHHRPGIPGKWFQFAAEVKAGGALAAIARCWSSGLRRASEKSATHLRAPTSTAGWRPKPHER